MVAAALAQQPPRDRVPIHSASTGRIAGIVLSDEGAPRPLRRARVILNADLPASGRTAITGDDGTFAFDGLAAGRYTLGAVKSAYLPMNYGARRSGRRGIPIMLRDGEARQVSVKLPRGAVITGTITDFVGEPAAGVVVQAGMLFAGDGGLGRVDEMRPGIPQRSLNASDSRGRYRIFGLPPGSYIVGAQPHIPPNTMLMTGERRQLVPVPIFYPGTAAVDQAIRMDLAPGEERTGVDFQLQLVPAATISGIIPAVPGASRLPAVQLIPKAAINGGTRSTRSASGQFRFTGVAPGAYTLAAESGLEIYTAEVTVDGTDISGVVLTQQPRLAISGRLVFEGWPAPKLGAPQQVPIDLSSSRHVWGVSAVIEPDGRFRIEGLRAGAHRVASRRGIRTAIGKWWIKSIAAEGRELLDAPLDLQHPMSDLVVTLTDRASQLSGAVTDEAGNPRPDFTVVVFGSNRATWFYNSRHVAGVEVASDGRYTIRNLPPGSYYLLATDELEANEWFHTEVLEKLVRRAMRISIGEYEQKSMDMVVS